MHRTALLARTALIAGVLAMLGAAVLLLWPLSANGVTGSALLPHYHEFGFATNQLLPDNPTRAQLRHAGVRLPWDVVAHRRHVAYATLAAGALIAALGAFVVIRTRRPPQHPDPGATD